jgi:hypothetical protein
MRLGLSGLQGPSGCVAIASGRPRVAGLACRAAQISQGVPRAAVAAQRAGRSRCVRVAAVAEPPAKSTAKESSSNVRVDNKEDAKFTASD